ncbi:carbamoyl phosphate synthase preATP-grasp domain-containing protein [Streptomyces sp. NPDC054834]
MPRRADLTSVLVLAGSEADLAAGAVEACRTLTRQGLRTVLLGSDPAALAAAVDAAHTTYAEPLTPRFVEQVIARERPDAVLADLGGAAARDTVEALCSAGVREKYDVEFIGADHVAACGAEGLRAVRAAARACGAESEAYRDSAARGWREYDLQVLRDRHGGTHVLCTAERVGAAGGDALFTVTPPQTPAARQIRHLADLARAAARALTAGAAALTLRIALSPDGRRSALVEPRPGAPWTVQRAATADGQPIGGLIARLAVGETVDELGLPPARRPDLVTVTVPRPDRGTGAVTARGATFRDAFNKALEQVVPADGEPPWSRPADDPTTQPAAQRVPSPDRVAAVVRALCSGAEPADIARATGIHPWFLNELSALHRTATDLGHARPLTRDDLLRAKRQGFGDRRIAALSGLPEQTVRGVRHTIGLRPGHPALHAVRTSVYTGGRPRTTGGGRDAVLVLGPGIWTGGGADHSCRQAALALRAAGWAPVLIDSTPRTLSAARDAFDRGYLEPLTAEAVLEAVEAERRAGTVAGVLGQFGGPDVAALARELQDGGAPLTDLSAPLAHLVTEADALGRALTAAGLRTTARRAAASLPEALAAAGELGYPVTVTRPHGPGHATRRTVADPTALASLLRGSSPGRPVLVERALRACVELGVDALYDGQELVLASVFEYLDGGHGDVPACALPPVSLGSGSVARLAEATARAARALGVRGALSVRFASAGDVLYVREVVPGTARTAPFTTAATRVPLAQAGARIAMGADLATLRAEGLLHAEGPRASTGADARVFVRAPGDGDRHGGALTAAGPEFGAAYAKYLIGLYGSLPTKGRAYLSVTGHDLRSLILPARRLTSYGFELFAGGDTFGALRRAGVPVTALPGSAHPEPPVVRLLRAGQLDLVLSAPGPADDRDETIAVRAAAAPQGVPCFTSVRALSAGVQAIGAVLDDRVQVAPLHERDHHRPVRRSGRPSHDHEEKR